MSAAEDSSVRWAVHSRPVRVHNCDLPDVTERRALGVGHDVVIRCRACGRLWQFNAEARGRRWTQVGRAARPWWRR